MKNHLDGGVFVIHDDAWLMFAARYCVCVEL